MGFTRKVRDEVLARSQRRCCVCHHFKGVGVEVHHIKPLADGGENTLQNAIVLCFDCHTAAGHYNSKHPKGTKYSPQELMLHRDDWWRRVELSGTTDPAPQELPDHHIRHLLCMSDDAAEELLNGEMKNMPFECSALQENNVTKFMRHILNDNGNSIRYDKESSSDYARKNIIPLKKNFMKLKWNLIIKPLALFCQEILAKTE